MGSTFSCLRVHIVFSTKERRPLISPAWRSRLHEYLGGTVRGLQAVPESVGGVADHVHLLVSYRPTLTISDFMRELKKASSVWAAENHEPLFGWQDGYAVFSVSASQKDRVSAYIAGQEEHHQRGTFREELEDLLLRHEIEFKPEYLE
jgi:REP element-mobilizing transposase RayT